MNGPGWAWSVREFLPERHRRDHVEFGTAIDSDGTRVIIGAPEADEGQGGEGAAYIVRRNSGGDYELEARLTPSVVDHGGRRSFGSAVAIDGDLALVGEPLKDHDHGPGSGYAHLFARNIHDSTWAEVCRFEGSELGRRVGSAVAVQSARALIGDPDRTVIRSGSSPSPGAGSVMVVEYTADEADPCRVAWVEPPDPRAALEFGASVAIDGDAIAVGAPGAEKVPSSYPDRINLNSGEITILRLVGGSWEHERTVDGALQRENRNGTSVELSGDWLLASATGRPGDGRVVLFEKDQGGTDHWGIREVFVEFDFCRDCDFGSSISIDDDLIAIGIPGFNPTEDGQNLDAGGVLVLRRSSTWSHLWLEEGILTRWAHKAGDRFGESVSVNGEFLTAGAPFFDLPAEDSGSVCWFVPTGLIFPKWQQEHCLTSVARPSARRGQYGFSVGLDSITMAIGQPGENTVHVYERQGMEDLGWAHSSSLRIEEGADTHDLRIGERLAVGENVIVVGVPYGGTVEFAAGVAYVLSDNGGGWQVGQTLVPPVDEAFLRFGIDVAVGESVIAVAAQGASMGSVFVYEPIAGPETAWMLAAEVTAPGSIGALPSPMAVAVDGDTIVACDHTWGGDQDHSGACDVFQRTPGGWIFVQRLIGSDSAPWRTFGYDVAIDQDTILIGAPFEGHDLHRLDALSYVFDRDDDGIWYETATIGHSVRTRHDHIGHSVALDGDLAVLGAPVAGDPTASGVAAVYRRTGELGGHWSQIAELSAPMPEFGAAFGSSIAIYGQEILVGSPLDSEQGPEAGSVALFAPRLVRSPAGRRAP